MADNSPSKPDPLMLPSEGGSYERLKDGSLRRIAEEETPDSSKDSPKDSPAPKASGATRKE